MTENGEGMMCESMQGGGGVGRGWREHRCRLIVSVAAPMRPPVLTQLERHELREQTHVEQLPQRHAPLATARSPPLGVEREEAEGGWEEEGPSQVEGFAHRARERRHLVVQPHLPVPRVRAPLEEAARHRHTVKPPNGETAEW